MLKWLTAKFDILNEEEIITKMLSKKILKRDGREVDFDASKIANAISKAVDPAEGDNPAVSLEDISKIVLDEIENKYGDSTTPEVEGVQDIIEKVLMTNGYPQTAKNYILYRADRTRIREMHGSLMKIYEGLTFVDSKDNDLKRENANIDGNTAMGTMLRYGSEGAKRFNELFVLKPEHSQAHINGDIHIHDLDFLTLTMTCCQIDLLKLFHDGFFTGHGTLREPTTIRSAAALACIAIQSNQNDQHGGQSIPAIDYYLAEYVKKSYVRSYLSNIKKALWLSLGISSKEIDKILNGMKENESDLPALTMGNIDKYQEVEKKYLLKLAEDEQFEFADKVEQAQKFAKDEALSETENETWQAMEALIHNLNTMQCFHETQEVHTLNGLTDVRHIRSRMNPVEREAFGKLLHKLYIEDGLLLKEVATELKMSKKTVTRALRYFGMELRDRKENSHNIKRFYKKTIGVESPSQLDEVKAKLAASQRANNGGVFAWNTAKQKQTMKERYGEHGEKIQEKVRATCQERYGCDYVFQSTEFREKAKRTNLERYGSENVFCAESSIRQELEARGVYHYAGTRSMEALREKYGENPLQSEEIQKKREQTFIEHYGTAHPGIGHFIPKKGQSNRTRTEQEIVDEIIENFPGLEMELNVRGLMPENRKYEVDIYFPTLKLAVEVNGTYSHDRKAYEDDLASGTSFTKEAKKHDWLDNGGIKLIFVWEEDWANFRAREATTLFYSIYKRMFEMMNGGNENV